MPALLTKNSDLEFDSLQPCFYPDEDHFYSCGPPSEDIWKKFELLPTPPLSPSRAALPGATSDLITAFGVDSSLPLGLGLTDPLDWASELFLLPEDDIWGASEGDLFGSALDTTNENSIIIQDCMWSGFSAREKLERAVKEKLGLGKATVGPVNGASPLTCSTNTTSVKPPTGTELNSSVTECVDPAVVFPFPVHKRNSTGSSSQTARGQTGTAVVSRVQDDTLSDSDDDEDEDEDEDEEEDEDDEDEDDEEEEDEEIDVVTVEKRRSGWSGGVSGGVVGGNKPPVELILKRSAAASLHQEQHNYAAPSPSDSASCVTSAPPSKRHRSDRLKPSSPLSASATLSATTTLPSSMGGRQRRLEASNGGGSDSDDMERRRNHNILERQRRNDLRSSFLTLRDQLPELASNHKAAKVLILKKATEYISSLETQQQRLQQEKDRLQARRQQLMRRLEQARTR